MDLPFESADDRALIEEEAAADPVFARRLRAALLLPDGEKRIALSARKAIVNELNPNLYPETRGLWKKLRSIARDLVRFISGSPEKHKVGARVEPALISNLNGLGELGQWDILGPLISTVVQTGANIYTSYTQQQTSRQLQQMQIDAQMAQLQAQQNIAEAQRAVANAQAAQTGAPGQVATAASDIVSNVADTLTQPVAGGIPLWAILLAVFFFAEKA